MASAKKSLKKPVWLKYTEDEVREIILKIVEKSPELTSEKIGLILRDNYGIPSTRIYNFKISEVLKKAGKYKCADLKNLEAKKANLESHTKTHIHDQRTKRSLIITKAKLKKRVEYESKRSSK
jgi:ribosomal protein S15P/S13E